MVVVVVVVVVEVVVVVVVSHESLPRSCGMCSEITVMSLQQILHLESFITAKISLEVIQDH